MPSYSQGNLWDTDTFNVTSLLNPGDTSETATIEGTRDCIVWVGQVFSATVGPRLIVAFGDSISAGEGDAVPTGLTGANCNVSPPAAYCGYASGIWTDSPQAYPAVLASSLGWHIDNFSISGACAGTDPCASSNNPTIAAELRTAAPLSLEPQLVTLTVGADDINFKDCAAGLLGLLGTKVAANSCYDSPAELTKLTSNVESVLNSIKTLYPGVQIALTMYFNPAPPSLSSNPNSICSSSNAPELAAALELEQGVSPTNLLPLVIADSFDKSAIIHAENALLSAVYSEAGSMVGLLNRALATAAANVGGVTTVTFNVSGHDFCEDYSGGNGGWVFGPRLYAFVAYVKGLISASLTKQYTPSDVCATYDAGCRTKGWTGEIQGARCRWHVIVYRHPRDQR